MTKYYRTTDSLYLREIEVVEGELRLSVVTRVPYVFFGGGLMERLNDSIFETRADALINYRKLIIKEISVLKERISYFEHDLKLVDVDIVIEGLENNPT